MRYDPQGRPREGPPRERLRQPPGLSQDRRSHHSRDQCSQPRRRRGPGAETGERSSQRRRCQLQPHTRGGRRETQKARNRWVRRPTGRCARRDHPLHGEQRVPEVPGGYRSADPRRSKPRGPRYQRNRDRDTRQPRVFRQAPGLAHGLLRPRPRPSGFEDPGELHPHRLDRSDDGASSTRGRNSHQVVGREPERLRALHRGERNARAPARRRDPPRRSALASLGARDLSRRWVPC